MLDVGYWVFILFFMRRTSNASTSVVDADLSASTGIFSSPRLLPVLLLPLACTIASAGSRRTRIHDGASRAAHALCVYGLAGAARDPESATHCCALRGYQTAKRTFTRTLSSRCSRPVLNPHQGGCSDHDHELHRRAHRPRHVDPCSDEPVFWRNCPASPAAASDQVRRLCVQR